MSERKLASIEIVNNIEPIEGANAIEKITVKGWQLVAKKGEFQKGDKCIYFEVDSFLPQIPQFNFLQAKGVKTLDLNGEKHSGYRLKTIKLRGQISQGLALPLSSFNLSTDKEGDDVTEELGILKYEIPESAVLGGVTKGNFPAFLSKTDEERIQNLPKYFRTMQGRHFYITEKIDGSSCTFYINNGEFGVCSRNMDLKETEKNSFWRIARELDIENKLKTLNKNIAIQGELCGPGIQKNRQGFTKLSFRLFNVFDIDKYERYNFNDIVQLCENLNIEMVPVINSDWVFTGTMQDVISMADGQSMINIKCKREGLIFRALDNNHISFKVISNKYLLKNE
jgi:RNA ligase (TIGR02306 family)